MTRPLAALCVAFTLAASAATTAVADSSPRTSAERQSDEAWLAKVRGSGSYREGMAKVDELISAAYDLGAIAGASHWEDIHEYYISLARAKGCQEGTPFATGPVKACHRVSGPEPKVVAKDYANGKRRTLALTEGMIYADLVKRVLLVLYDYGYVQGLKHGLRVHNDEMRLTQTYYRSCMARANDAKGESSCAKSSKSWSNALLTRLRDSVEAHGLPARSKP